MRFAALYLMFLFMFLLFFCIVLMAYHQGYIDLNILFYEEKALLAIKGSPPRLENIGFVYPPLAFLPFLFVKDYIMVSPLVSAVLMTAFMAFMVSRDSSTPIYMFLAFLLVNPLVLFLASYKFEILSFYILLVLSVVSLIYHLETGYSFYIFASGLLFGICFFLDFRSLFLIPFFAVSIFLSTRDKDASYSMALTIVKLSPIIFFAFSWMYLNWIFTGSPLYFVKSPYSFFKSEPVDVSLLIVKGKVLGSILYALKMLIYYLPVSFPYFLLLFRIRKYKVFYMIPLYMVYLFPVILMVFSIYFNTFFPAYYYAVIFLMFAVAFVIVLNIKPTKYFMFAVFISLITSWILPLHSKDLNEREFVKFLITGKIKNNTKEYKKVANVIKDDACKKVLIDDATGFPVVVFAKNPGYFYLPYMYEYYTVLSYPWAFVNCVVIDKSSSNDSIANQFPTSRFGYFKGYYLIYSGKNYNIFKLSSYGAK